MKKTKLKYLLIMLLVMSIVFGFAYNHSKEPTIAIFNTQDEVNQNVDEAFDKMMSVLTHKRCVNCHPAGDRPRQGEDSHIHNFDVQRGPDNHGLPALKCESCHQQENNNFSGVPGAPEWSLAPLAMRWEGLTKVEIARSILDRSINGNRSLEETVEHLTEHELVLWAWEPGVDANGVPREKPPVPLDEYIEAVKEWAEAGAPIPEE